MYPMITLRPLCAALLAVCILAAAEDDPVVKELTRHDEAVAKLQKNFDDGNAKERARSIPIIGAIAKKLIGKGDMPGGVKAWKAVLRLDDQHAEAREFFTSIGQLDKILAEIEAEQSAGGDLLGDGAGPVMGRPWEGSAVVHAEKPLQLGDLPAGTRISLQYQSGTWTFRRGVQPMRSPDDVASQAPFRLVFAAEPGLLVELPAGTATTPWIWTAPADVKGAVLRLSRTSGPAPGGEVTYRITVAKPKAK